jgi:hypothetical protein
MLKALFIYLPLTLFCLAPNAMAEDQEPSSQFIDKEDGWLDASEWLIENAYGFLPVPIIITEPAVDNGLGMAGVFFHKPKETDKQQEKGKALLTDITAVAAAYTGNDSWFVGGGHFNTMQDDTVRFSGGLGVAEINLDLFFTGPFGNEQVLEFSTTGFFLSPELTFRMGESNWFLGGSWRYIGSDYTVNNCPGAPFPQSVCKNDDRISGLSAVAHYEDVNSRMSPTQGLKLDLIATANNESIGSDYDYEELTWKYRQYLTFDNQFELRWRIDGATTTGDVPFYLEPAIQLEGIPAARYQGPTAVTAELRGGWRFHPRWTVLAFAGAGRTSDVIGDLGSAASHTSVGTGFRYLMAKVLGLRVGLDIARGPEETYVYLITGSAWGGIGF